MMRNHLFLVFLLVTGVCLKAQTTLNEAVDFEVTDIDGNDIHLFDILDRGQAVFVEFISSECDGCKQSTPFMVEACPLMGCNMHDVFFMEISYNDSDSALMLWRQKHGEIYPIIGQEGGGDNVFDTYNIKTCPTFVLIKPDRSIAVKVMYPFSTEYIIGQLSSFGILQNNCAVVTPERLNVELHDGFVYINWGTVGSYSYNIYRNGVLIANVRDSIFLDSGLQNQMEYCYAVASVYANGQVSEPCEEECLSIGDANIVQCIEMIGLSPNPVFDKAILNISENSVVKLVSTNGQTICEWNAPIGRFTLDFSRIRSGNYFVQILNGKCIISHKIVIMH